MFDFLTTSDDLWRLDQLEEDFLKSFEKRCNCAAAQYCVVLEWMLKRRPAEVEREKTSEGQSDCL